MVTNIKRGPDVHSKNSKPMELFQYPDRLVHSVSISNVTCFTVGKGKEAAVFPDVNHLAVHAIIHSRCHHGQSSTVCVASRVVKALS